MLPRRDGFEVLAGIRQLGAPVCDIPVLLLSDGSVTNQYRQRARKLGAIAILNKPVPLAMLHKLVGRYIKAPPPAVARTAQKEAPLAGTFAELSFPHLLHHLHGLRASGVLSLVSGKKRKAVQIRDGYAVAVKSNLVGECLGNYLMRRGVVSEAKMEESLRRMKKGEGLQGQILVAMQVADEHLIARALRGQAEHKLFEIFEWKHGRFKFEIGARLEDANALALDQSPANVIISGIRNRLPLESVTAFLARNGNRFLARGESPFYRLQEIDLTSTEQALLARLDGSQRLSEFASAEESVRRLLYGLVVTEILHLEGERKAGAAPPMPGSTDAGPTLPRPGSSSSSRSSSLPCSRPTSGSERVRDAQEARAGDAQRAELAARAKQLRTQSYFEMLGVMDTSGSDEIELAYETIAKAFHPDRFNSASGAVRQLADEVFQMLSTARATLVDTKGRLEYESARRRGRRKTKEESAGERSANAETQFQVGESKLRARDYEGALVCFGKAMELNSEEGEYYAHYGWCLHLCHPDDALMVEEAIEHVRRGVRLAPDREKPYLFLGRLYKVVGRAVAAEKMFTRAVQIQSNCVEAMRELRLINLRREKSRGIINKIFRK